MSVPERYFRASVNQISTLNDVLRRVVLGGPGLKAYRSSGVADEWFRLFLPAVVEGQSDEPVELPGWVEGGWQFPSPEPVSRWYTVRGWDPDAHQLTVDVVRHGHGRAAEWAELARPGDEVVISSPAGRYEPPADTEWELIVADLTGLPAASRILSELPAGRRARAILEVPNESCVLALPVGADVTVSWIFNPRADTIPSALNLATRSLDLPPGRGYVWMAGEAACSRETRRYVRHELGWPSSTFDIVGYWRPDAEAYLRRYAAIEDQVAQIYEASYLAGHDREDTADQVYAVMEQHGL